MTTLDKLNGIEKERIQKLMISLPANKELLVDDLELLTKDPAKYWLSFDTALPCTKERKQDISYMQGYYELA